MVITVALGEFGRISSGILGDACGRVLYSLYKIAIFMVFTAALGGFGRISSGKLGDDVVWPIRVESRSRLRNG